MRSLPQTALSLSAGDIRPPRAAKRDTICLVGFHLELSQQGVQLLRLLSGEVPRVIARAGGNFPTERRTR